MVAQLLPQIAMVLGRKFRPPVERRYGIEILIAEADVFFSSCFAVLLPVRRASIMRSTLSVPFTRNRRHVYRNPRIARPKTVAGYFSHQLYTAFS